MNSKTEKFLLEIRAAGQIVSGAANLSGGAILLKRGCFGGDFEILVDCEDSIFYVCPSRKAALPSNAVISGTYPDGWARTLHVAVWAIKRSEDVMERAKQLRNEGASEIKRLFDQAAAERGENELFSEIDDDGSVQDWWRGLPRDYQLRLEPVLQRLTNMEVGHFHRERVFRLSDGSGVSFNKYGGIVTVAENADFALAFPNPD